MTGNNTQHRPKYINEMIGHTEVLEPNDAIRHWKSKGVDFANILKQPDAAPEVGRYQTRPQDHGLDKSLDRTVLLDLCRPAIEEGKTVRADELRREALRDFWSE